MSTSPPLIANTTPGIQSAFLALDKREKRFVVAYVASLNGSRAIVEAGYKGRHPSRKAYKLLQRPDVRSAIEEYERYYLAELGARAVTAMRETLAIATSDPRKLVWQEFEDIPAGKKVGDRKELQELDGMTASAIAGLEVEEISSNGEHGRRFKYKLWDKNKALDRLGQYTKLWDAKGNVTNIDARTVNNTANTTVAVGNAEGLRESVSLLEQIRTIAALPGHAPGDSDGSLLPAAVRPESAGRGAPVDAGADSGSGGAAKRTP